MDTNVIPVTEQSEDRPASALEMMQEAVHEAQAIFLYDLIKRIKACGETLELCTDELAESRLKLSSDVFKTWRAVDKHLLQLIDDLETDWARLMSESSG
jgi:hypothetical protein